MNNDLFRILLLGILIYQFCKITFKSRVIEGLPPTSLNWSTTDNPTGKSMIKNNPGLKILEQGECGSCIAYSLATLMSCQYNIYMNPIPDPSDSSTPVTQANISITPQSIIDIILRYNFTPVRYHNYHVLSQTSTTLTGDQFKDSTFNRGPQRPLPDCGILLPDGTNLDGGTGCGFELGNGTIPKGILEDILCLKDLSCLSATGDTVGQPSQPDQVGKPKKTYNFPLLNSTATGNDGTPYETVTRICSKHILFNEDLVKIQESNYDYTESFTSNSFVDFNFVIDSPFSSWDTVTSDSFEQTIKDKLEEGPLSIVIHTDDQATYTPQGLINLKNGSYMNYLNKVGVVTNHALLIIGYTGDNLVLLNSWPPNLHSGESSTDLQDYVTNDITFPVLFTHLKSLDSYSSDNICGIRITEAEKQIETIEEEVEEYIEAESGPVKIILIFVVVILLLILASVFIGKKKMTRKTETAWVEIDRSLSSDSDGSGGSPVLEP